MNENPKNKNTFLPKPRKTKTFEISNIIQKSGLTGNRQNRLKTQTAPIEDNNNRINAKKTSKSQSKVHVNLLIPQLLQSKKTRNNNKVLKVIKSKPPPKIKTKKNNFLNF